MRFHNFCTPPKDLNLIVNKDCLLYIITIYLCMQVIAIHITGTEIDHLGVLKAQVGLSVCLSVCLSACLSVYLCAPILYYIIFVIYRMVWYSIVSHSYILPYFTLSFYLILFYTPVVHCTALNFLNLTMHIAASYLSRVYLKFKGKSY